MAYFAPYIDETGIHIPTYADIRDDLLQQCRDIYGQDIYLEPDSQDYQYISIFTNKVNDTNQALQAVYDSRSPGSAIGAGLDTLVKLNGISRSRATYSTCVATLTGTPGVVINNGVAQDINGYKWNLPATITIGTLGVVDATLVAQQVGSIYANPGDINIISTPTYGWFTINNVFSATPGVALETDSKLKGRQAISTAQPSRTILEGTKGAIAAIIGVVRYEVYENDTDIVDVNGLPPHSITAVVEGGRDADIAQAIFLKKGPGCYTNGTTSVDVSDQFGQLTTIRFYRPTYIDIDVVVSLKSLVGYTTQDAVNVKNAEVSFLNSIAMGDDLPISSLWGAALSALTSLTKPTFSVTSITAALHGGTQGTSDITVAFNEAIRGNISYITVNIV